MNGFKIMCNRDSWCRSKFSLSPVAWLILEKQQKGTGKAEVKIQIDKKINKGKNKREKNQRKTQ